MIAPALTPFRIISSEPAPMAGTGTVLGSGVRFRAYPDSSAGEAIPRWIGCQRVIYNGKTAEDHLFAQQWRMAMRDDPDSELQTPLDQQYAHFKNKEQTPWLYDVPAEVLRNGAFRWFSAKQRQLKGLAKAPTFRNRSNFNSVLLTSELFRFREKTDPRTGKLSHEIEIGKEAHPVGVFQFTARAPYKVPRMIVIRITGSGKWFVSFCFERSSDTILREPHELAYEVNRLSDSELEDTVLAFDRNVADNCFADSRGNFHDFLEAQKNRLARKEVGRKRHQRKLARQKVGSKNSQKTKCKIAKSYEYGGDVRKNFAHQLSHAIASDDTVKVVGFEGLKIQNMVKKPKAKQDPVTGKWLRNGAKAKAGLARRILGSAWGITAQCTKYKMARRNKLVVTSPAAYSSQECSQCGHTPGVFLRLRLRAHSCRQSERFPVCLSKLWVCVSCRLQCGVSHQEEDYHPDSLGRAGEASQSEEAGRLQTQKEFNRGRQPQPCAVGGNTDGAGARYACGARVIRVVADACHRAFCALKQEETATYRFSL